MFTVGSPYHLFMMEAERDALLQDIARAFIKAREAGYDVDNYSVQNHIFAKFDMSRKDFSRQDFNTINDYIEAFE